MAQQKFKIEINSYLNQILQQSEREDQDILNFVQLLGHKKVFDVIQDTQLKQMLKQVIKQDQLINQIVQWITNYKIMLQDEKKKKNKVPQIYSSSTGSGKKNQLSQKKKNFNQGETSKIIKTQNVNDSGKKKIQQEDKPKIFDRFQQQQPAIKKKVKKEAQKNEKNQSEKIEEKIQIEKTHELIAQGKVKCKYFPFCKNEQCQFFHPTQKVIQFFIINQMYQNKICPKDDSQKIQIV